MCSPSPPGSYLLPVTVLLITIWSVSCDYPAFDLLTKFANSQVLLMGLLESRMFILTNDTPPHVYEIDRHKVTNRSINLYGMKSELLETKWPTLYTFTNFSEYVLLNTKIDACCTTIKFENEELYFAYSDRADITATKRLLMTVAFALETQSASLQDYEMQDLDPIIEGHYISSIEPNVYYNLKIRKVENTNLNYQVQLYKNVFKTTRFEVLFKVDVCNYDDTTGRILFQNLYTPLCSAVQWNTQHGFTDGVTFRLFSSDKVYIFPHNLAISNHPINVTISNLSDHLVAVEPSTIPTFTTNSTPMPTLVPTTHQQASHASTFIIIGIVLVLLVIAAMAVAWLLYECFGVKDGNKNPNQIALAISKCKDNKSKSISKKSDLKKSALKYKKSAQSKSGQKKSVVNKSKQWPFGGKSKKKSKMVKVMTKGPKSKSSRKGITSKQKSMAKSAKK